MIDNQKTDVSFVKLCLLKRYSTARSSENIILLSLESDGHQIEDYRLVIYDEYLEHKNLSDPRRCAFR